MTYPKRSIYADNYRQNNYQFDYDILLQRSYSTSPSQRSYGTSEAEFNRDVAIEKEYQKNICDEQFQRKLRFIQDELNKSQSPQFYFPNQSFIGTLPSSLLEVSSSFVVNTNFPPVFACYGILGSIAIASSKHPLKIKVDQNWFESPCLHFAFIGEAGSRKTLLSSHLREPFDTFYAINQSDYTKEISKLIREVNRDTEKKIKEEMRLACQEVGSAEERMFLIKTAAEKIDEGKIEEEFFSSILVDSCTTCGVINHLDKCNEWCGAITAEGDILDALLLSRNADQSLFNKSYCMETYTKETSRGNITLKHPRVSTVSFIQPNIALKLYTNSKLVSSGAAARIFPLFLDSYNEQNIGSIIASSEAKSKYTNKIHYLLGLDQKIPEANGYLVKLDEQACKAIKSFENSVQAMSLDYAQECGPSLRKLHGLAVRMAWGIHVWNNDEPFKSDITVEEVTIAIQLCKYLLNHIDWAYNPIYFQSHDIAVKIIKYLKDINHTFGYDLLAQCWIESSSISRKLNIRANQISLALQYLEQSRCVKVVNSGKKSDVVVIRRCYSKSIYA